jgi:hypothetical protein
LGENHWKPRKNLGNLGCWWWLMVINGDEYLGWLF